MAVTTSIHLSGSGVSTNPHVKLLLHALPPIHGYLRPRMFRTPVMRRLGYAPSHAAAVCFAAHQVISVKSFTTFPAFYRPDAVAEQPMNTVRKTPRLFPPIQGSQSQ